MKKRLLLLSTLIISIVLLGCSGDPYGTISLVFGSQDMEVGWEAQAKLVVYDASGSDITYYWKQDKDQADWDETKDGFSPRYTYSKAGTFELQGYAFDGSSYTPIQSVTIKVNYPYTPGDYPLHTNIKATTFWVGEEGSDDNHNISNVPSAWDNSWGDDFGIEDHPTWLSRDNEHFPDHPSYKHKENPFYFALPYNDYGELVFDGENKQQANADSKPEYYKEYDSDYGRDIVKSNKMGDYYSDWRRETVNRIYWKDSQNWNGKSMVKGRWARIRYNGGDWVYAQWLDAGPYHYDDVDYVFGNARPRNDNSTLGESPYAGIDLSPSVMLSMGVQLSDWGATLDGGIDWEFVDEQNVPAGPWTRVKSDNYTNW